MFIDKKAELAFSSLKEDDAVRKSIVRTIHILKQNAFSGIQVPKRLIPKEYIKKYGINNLWKHDLCMGWRLLYTIVAEDQVKLISAILEWSDHKAYERRFCY